LEYLTRKIRENGWEEKYSGRSTKYEKKDEKERREGLVGDCFGREEGRKGRCAKQGIKKRGVGVGNVELGLLP
jgi:hypothetical protein